MGVHRWVLALTSLPHSQALIIRKKPSYLDSFRL